MHPGYIIQKGKSPENQGELELIESVVFSKNKRFASRKRVSEVLSQRYSGFDLSLFEGCVADFLQIERWLADGSIETTPPPSGL
jgi:hypothetical protein